MEDCMINEPERYTLPWEVEEDEGPDWRFIVCAGCALGDNVEEARRLVEEPSGEWNAVEISRQLIEGKPLEDESELERARR